MPTSAQLTTTIRVCEAIKASALARASSSYRFADDRLSRAVSAIYRACPTEEDPMYEAEFGYLTWVRYQHKADALAQSFGLRGLSEVYTELERRLAGVRWQDWVPAPLPPYYKLANQTPKGPFYIVDIVRNPDSFTAWSPR